MRLHVLRRGISARLGPGRNPEFWRAFSSAGCTAARRLAHNGPKAWSFAIAPGASPCRSAGIARTSGVRSCWTVVESGSELLEIEVDGVTQEIDSTALSGLVQVLERRSTRFWGGSAIGGAAVAVATATGLGLLAGARGAAIALSVSVAFALIALVLAGAVIRLARALTDARARQELQAVDDDLTGLSNRRHFLGLVEREFARCRRYGDDGALLLIDADHLRRINEHLGQLCGDALLLEVTRRVGATLRQADLLARFGGAQLAVFLPSTDPLGALDAAERIRQQVASSPYQWQQTHVVATVSIGVATVHQGQLSVDTMVHEGEQALEAAKEAGRNCVRTGPIKPRRNGERVAS